MASKFRFNTVVSDVLCTSERNWIVEYDGLKTRRFTFVIVCNGLVSSKPNFPLLEGAETFKNNGGVIIHSSERREDTNLEGKRVLVIGNGKSAVDAAAAAAAAAQASGGLPPIQLARRQNWYVPRYILGILQYKWAFHTRIGSTLLPRYFETTHIFLKIMHAIFTPVKWLLWRIVELLLLAQYRLPVRLWPKLGTVVDTALETSALITDEAHLKLLRNGRIDMRIGTVQRLEANKAILSDGREEPVDVVILGTGWKLSYDTFMSGNSIFAGLDFDHEILNFESDGLWLYRNMLPAGFKGMAFVGANTLTFMNIFTSYVQAYWLAQLLAGVRPWPEEAHMNVTIEREKVHKRKYYRAGELRAASVECYMQHYHDVLFREMNARKPFNCLIRPIADLVVPVLPCTMKGCLEPLHTDSVNGAANGTTEMSNGSFTSERLVNLNFEDEKGVKTVVNV